MAGIRTPAADRRAREGDARGLRAAARDHHAPGEALQGRAGLRVHHPGQHALHAPDPQRQAHGRWPRCTSRWTWWRRASSRQKEAVAQVEPQSLDQLLHPIFDPKERAKAEVAAKGLPASPGAATGAVVFTADDAVAWSAEGQARRAGAHGDGAGRHPRHERGPGHPHRHRRHDLARGGGRAARWASPPWSAAARCDIDAKAQAAEGRRAGPSRKATASPSTARTGRGHPAASCPPAPPRSCRSWRAR